MENTDLGELAKKRVQAKLGLAIHLAMYFVVNAGLVAAWFATGAHYPWFIWPMLGWGVGIVGHVMAFFYGPGSRGEERAISRELNRLRSRTH